jgi:hypothetical protein
MMAAGSDTDQKKISPDGEYDGFEVVAAWKIVNETRKAKYVAALERERAKVREYASAAGDGGGGGGDLRLPLNLPNEIEAVVEELGEGRLCREAGEVYLLHGTATENLHSILFEGLDPRVANDGNFGRGVYFAENVRISSSSHF